MRWDSVPGRNHEGNPDPTAAQALRSVLRSQRGRQSRQTGELFEQMIDDSLKWYRWQGTAAIEKTPEPMKPLARPNNRGQFLACYVKAAQPDYKGTLRGGRAVVFEAKHTDSDRIEFDRLTQEQIGALTDHDRLGAAAYVLVSFGLESFYRVPWPVWRDMKTVFGRKYMKEPELEPYRVQRVAGVLKLLDGVETLPARPDPEAMDMIDEVLEALAEAEDEGTRSKGKLLAKASALLKGADT